VSVCLCVCAFARAQHVSARAAQHDAITWMLWLKNHLGFGAFRLDNTKGYAGAPSPALERPGAGAHGRVWSVLLW